MHHHLVRKYQFEFLTCTALGGRPSSPHSTPLLRTAVATLQAECCMAHLLRPRALSSPLACVRLRACSSLRTGPATTASLHSAAAARSSSAAHRSSLLAALQWQTPVDACSPTPLVLPTMQSHMCVAAFTRAPLAGMRAGLGCMIYA